MSSRDAEGQAFRVALLSKPRSIGPGSLTMATVSDLVSCATSVLPVATYSPGAACSLDRPQLARGNAMPIDLQSSTRMRSDRSRPLGELPVCSAIPEY